MIKNLAHALMGAVAFLGLGWLVVQPAAATWMAHHKDDRYAAAGALVVLALFVIVCLVKALKPGKPAARTAPYAAAARRR